MVWWGVLGMGMGLILLAGLTWVRHDAGDGTALAMESGPLPESIATPPSAPQVLAPVASEKAEPAAVAPVMQAIADAAQQRRHALMAYHAQIGAAGLGDALTPASLAAPSGRRGARQSLARLESALDALIRQDAEVQLQLDQTVQAWLRDAPQWGDATQRQTLADASASKAATMTQFFKVERDIVAQVNALLNYLDKLGKGVRVEGTGQQQELAFAKASDLAYYRATLSQLGELGRHEQELLAQAQKAGGTQAQPVGNLASSEDF